MRGWAETPFILAHNRALEGIRSYSRGTYMSPGHSGEGLRPRGTQSGLTSHALEVMGHSSCPCFPQVTPSFGLQAQRPGLSRPPWSLVVLMPLPRRPPHPALPSASSLGRHLLQELPSKMASRSLCPDTHSWSLSGLLGQHSQGWVSLGISFSKTPEGARFSLNPQPHLSILPDLGGDHVGVTPDAPILVCQAVLSGSARPGRPLQLPQRSFPDTTHHSRASDCLGAGDALREAPTPTSPALL